MSFSFEELLDKATNRQCRVGIVGLGYVGLPLVKAFCMAGFPVLGFDTDTGKIAALQRGESYIGHLPSTVILLLRERGFEVTDCFERLDEPDAILMCVPTPLTKAREPDLSHIINSTEAIARRLRTGQLIVLESTTYPGTTRQVVKPILESGGLRAGQDFFLAYSPEREDPGNPVFSAPTIPKVVGGFDPKSQLLATSLYRQVVVQVVEVSSPEVAEACKILENTYRAVNIALVNELKVLYDRLGLNIWEVIEAARTKPFGFQPFYPGPGLGGHCIPIDPFYLTWLAKQHGLATRFIELAGEVNTSMPGFVMSKLTAALNERGRPVKGSRIVLLGMAYKEDVDDPRESPGFELMDLLIKGGAIVQYNDPHIPVLPAMRRYPHLPLLHSCPLTPEFLQSQDGVVIVAAHSGYEWAWIVRHAALVVDTRNATRQVADHRDRIVLA